MATLLKRTPMHSSDMSNNHGMYSCWSDEIPQRVLQMAQEPYVSSQSSNGKTIPPSPEAMGRRKNLTSRKPMHEALPYMQIEVPITGDMSSLSADPMSEIDLHYTSTSFNSVAVLIGAIFGTGLGLLLTTSTNMSSHTRIWLALPGELFIRAVRCLIVPFVFVSVAVSIAEVMMNLSRSILTWHAVPIFGLTSILSTLQGIITALIFRSFFDPAAGSAPISLNTSMPLMAYQCPNGLFLKSSSSNGSLMCLGLNDTEKTILFNITNVNHQLSHGQYRNTVSMQNISSIQQIIAFVNIMVPHNLFQAFVEGSLISIITFALPLGFAVAASATHSNKRNKELLQVMRQIRQTMYLLLQYVLQASPVAVFFLIASDIVSYETYHESAVVSQGGYFIIAHLLSVFSHVAIVMPLMLFLFTRVQPYRYIRKLVPVFVFACASSSSTATLPFAVNAIHQTQQVTRRMAHLVMSIGTPLNTNASGLYYPLTIIFMSNMSGLTLSTPQIFVLFFASLLGTMGTAPVPHANLIMLITVWRTVFPDHAEPRAFEYIFVANFFLDRISSMVNVNGNMIVTRIVAKYVIPDNIIN